MPRLSEPNTGRQGERLTPQFRELAAAFEAERVRLAEDTPDEVDPALVVVFDLAGSVKDFRNAIDRIEGLEFLSELLGERADPDDDFHMVDRKTGRTDNSVLHSLYLVMSNARAIDELLRLFALWQDDPSAKFEYRLGKFKTAFQQLAAIRRWGPQDRIRETGLRERSLRLQPRRINATSDYLEHVLSHHPDAPPDGCHHYESLIFETPDAAAEPPPRTRGVK